jgi:hypothetical protein
MEARTQTIGEFLGELFPGCDIAAGLNRVMTFVETLADRIQAVLERVIIPVCEMVERLEKLPPAPGYPPRHAAFRGEMMRHVMGCLRVATEPVKSRDIATVVMKARGLNPDDAELLVTIRKRVGACMWKLKQAGYAREVPIAGELKGWIRSE